MSGEAPAGWRVGRISDLVAESAVRVDPQALADPDTPYVGLEDIGQGTGTIVSFGRASSATSQKSAFAPGDILFGKLRPNLKKVAHPDLHGICSTDIVVFRAKTDADPDFAFRVLSSDPVIEHAVAQSAGTKMPRAHASSVLSFGTFLPPLDEQRRIAEVLRSVDEAIAHNESAGHAARGLVRQIASDIAARATDSAPIGSLWDVVTGRTPAPDNLELWDGELPFVTPGDVNDQDVSVRSSARSLNAFAPHGGRVVPAGSLLVTCIGSTVGKMGVSHVEVSTNQQINAVCCSPESSGYAYVACLSILDEILANAGRQAVPIINKTTFASLKIPLLSPVEMNEINEMVLALDEEIITGRQAIHQLRQMKTCLYSDLLSGRVRVPA